MLVLAVGLSFALTSVALAIAAEDELDKIKQTTGVEASLSVNPEEFQEALSSALEDAGGGFRAVRIGGANVADPVRTEDVEASLNKTEASLSPE